jgi:hypothetical protein
MTLRMDFFMPQPRARTWPQREELTWLARDPLKLISLVAVVLAIVVAALCVTVLGMSHTAGERQKHLDNLENRVDIQQAEINGLRNRMEMTSAVLPR